MKAWDKFLKDVRQWAPGTPAPVAENAVLRAAQEFCEITRAWCVEMDAISTNATTLEYDIPLDKNVELVRIESATLGNSDMPVWRTGPSLGRRYVFTPDGRTVRLASSPADGAALVLTCAVRPGEAATGIDDVIHARYAKDIAKGAVAILLNDAGRHLAFEERCADIKVQLWRGLSAARPRARPTFF